MTPLYEFLFEIACALLALCGVGAVTLFIFSLERMVP
jgi:hypothetical protein